MQAGTHVASSREGTLESLALPRQTTIEILNTL
jgi:hypothetical protein